MDETRGYPTIDEVAAAMGFDRRRKRERHVWGDVLSVNADGSYQVAILGSEARAARCCNASAGDRVSVLLMESGKCAAMARLGGTECSDVVFEGDSNGWYVKKYESGRAEVWGWRSQAVSGSTDNWHWMSASEQFGGWAWPFEWAEKGPLAHIRAETSSGNVWLTYGPSSTTNAPYCWAISSQAFSETIGICIYAQGRWR